MVAQIPYILCRDLENNQIGRILKVMFKDLTSLTRL